MGSWVEVELSGAWTEQTQASGSSFALGLTDLLRCMDGMGKDDRVRGLLIRVRGSGGSFASAQSLGRAIQELRDRGRQVVVWAESLNDAQYLALCGADRIWLPESGTLFLMGVRTERFFVRDLLDRVGARPEVVHVGKYKSAGDTFTRGSMSEEEREQVESWQNDVFEDLVHSISEGRDLDETSVKARIDQGPYPAKAALAAGLIDELAYLDEIPERLVAGMVRDDQQSEGARHFQSVPGLDYFKNRVSDMAPVSLWRDSPRIACLIAEGSVQRGSGQRGITSEGTIQWLEALRTDPSVRGVLLRIDSPGGDALASDLIHREVQRLGKEKPVVVSMGDVAASGGYYMAAPADSIFAEVGTITGSIGVLGVKLNLSGLYERLGIAKEGIQKGARAGLFSDAHGLSSDERAALRQEMDAFYATFLERVSDGRNLTTAEVDSIAQGRIWSGRRAQAVGLVDRVGGPLEALRDLAKRAGFEQDEPYAVVMLPPTSRWTEWLRGAMSGQNPFARSQQGRGPRIR